MSGLRAGVPLAAFKRFSEPILGKMLQPQKGRETDIEVPYLKAGHVQWGGIELPDELPEMWVSPSDTATHHPVAGDLLICEGGEVGRAALVDKELPPETIIQNSLHLVREGARACPRYLKYALEYVSATGWLDLVCNKATIAHLTLDKLRELPIPYWKKEEQRRIANFLDEQTARIDALIAEKERLVGLLSESMDAAIERAVLPETEFKSLLPLKRVVKRIITGPFGSALHSSDYVEGGIPVINPSHIINGWLEPDSATSIPEDMAESLSGYRMAEGELVVGRRGEMGRCAVVSPEAENWLCGTGCLLVTVDAEKILSAYAQLVISSRASREWLSLASVGSTMENLNTEILGRLPGYFPSVDEQRVRLNVANDSRVAHFKLIEHSQAHVSLLREYRSSLISAAVTGRIDINNYQMEAA